MPIARLLHQEIALYLEQHSAPAARVAQHWSDAQEWGLAGTAYVAAAKVALQASRRVEEVAYWDAAFNCFQRGGMRAEAFRARSESVESVLVVASAERARTATEELLALAHDDAERLDAMLAHATVQLMAVECEKAIETARASIVLAPGLQAPWPGDDPAPLLSI